VADLIAIGYDDEQTAHRAAEEVERLAQDMVRPGTSALFMIVENDLTDKALTALSRFGGTVLKSSLSTETERQLQQALHGGSGTPADDREAETVGTTS
jgi:uncharacterized membrane protein